MDSRVVLLNAKIPKKYTIGRVRNLRCSSNYKLNLAVPNYYIYVLQEQNITNHYDYNSYSTITHTIYTLVNITLILLLIHSSVIQIYGLWTFVRGILIRHCSWERLSK